MDDKVSSQTSDVELRGHYGPIVDALVDGRLVPFLGAGAHRCIGTSDGQPALPDGRELANRMIRSYWDMVQEHDDLGRVSQYVMSMTGDGAFYQNLRQEFSKPAPTTPVHQFVAGAWKAAIARDYRPGYPLIMTTNYDIVMEQALDEIGMTYDVVYYRSDKLRRGLFVHVPPGGGPGIPITQPDDYTSVTTDERPVILKLHGALERLPAPGQKPTDSFVITEDHYLAYLSGQDIKNLLPSPLRDKLVNSHFLFLGYGLRDWNLRVMMHQIAIERQSVFSSWAVQRHVDPLDATIWRDRKVHLVDADLTRFIDGLQKAFDDRLQRGGQW